MCSRTSPTELECMKPNVNSITDMCRKCNIKASIVLQSKFPYCRQCFLEYFKHKFRATLGKTKIMKHGDKILIGFSGSASSLCLIDLINDCLKDGKKKKMSFDVNVLFIDEKSTYDKKYAVTRSYLNDIKDILSPYQFKLFSTDLGAYLADDIHLDINNLYSDTTRIDEIKQLFLTVKTLTSKIDLLEKIRYNILFNVADKLGCQKIFSADTSDHLAIKTIANIVQGRGGQLPQDVGFCDDRFNTVKLIRPLQDCSRKEVTYYNLFNKLTPLIFPTFCTKTDKYSSVQKLSENFINDLQSTFPSTVLTIHATGGKLSTVKGQGNLYCCLCQGNLDQRRLPLTAQQASNISKLVSNLGFDGFDSTHLMPKTSSNQSCQSSCSENGCPCSEETDKFLETALCYGCQLLIRDCDSLESLPKKFLAKLQEKSQFNKMHDEIKAFLL